MNTNENLRVEDYANTNIEKGKRYIKGEEKPYTGILEEYYESGLLQRKGTFVDGDEKGEFISYYNNGEINTKFNFDISDFEGEYLEYHKNGQLKKKCFYKNKKLEGEYREYHESGNISKESFFKNGKNVGSEKVYYDNGKLEMISPFDEEGMPIVKETIFYYIDGKIESNTKVEADGTSRMYFYYPNGTVKSYISAKDGNMDGDCVEYYESGKIREKLTFKNGLPVGEKIVYSESGEIIERESL